MKRKIIFIFLGLIILLGIGVFVYRSNQKIVAQPKITEVIPQNIASTPSAHMNSYVDESGFTFQYPSDITIQPKETQDNKTYAYLAMTSSVVKGSVELIAADTSYESSESWSKGVNQSSFGGQKVVTFGGLSAIELTGKNNSKTGAVDKKILFTIDVSYGDQKDYWVAVYNRVLSTFAFSPVKNTAVFNDSSDAVNSTSDVTEEDVTQE